MKHFVSLWFPILVWMSLIFYISSIPDLEPEFGSKGVNTLISKMAHILEYAILMYLMIRALKGENLSLSFQSLLQLAFLITLLYAISDEYHQLFVQGREGTFRDVMIDSIGTAIVPLYLSVRLRTKHNHRYF